MNALMDFVEMKHIDRTYKEAVFLWNWECYVNKYGHQAGIFENGFQAITNECLNGFCWNQAHR